MHVTASKQKIKIRRYRKQKESIAKSRFVFLSKGFEEYINPWFFREFIESTWAVAKGTLVKVYPVEAADCVHGKLLELGSIHKGDSRKGSVLFGNQNCKNSCLFLVLISSKGPQISSMCQNILWRLSQSRAHTNTPALENHTKENLAIKTQLANATEYVNQRTVQKWLKIGRFTKNVIFKST